MPGESKNGIFERLACSKRRQRILKIEDGKPILSNYDEAIAMNLCIIIFRFDSVFDACMFFHLELKLL
jgi:hypothetical protein